MALENMDKNDFLDQLKNETIEIDENVSSLVVKIDHELFNKKVDKKIWSIAECIQHLNLTLDIYIPQMTNRVKDKSQFTPESEIFKHSVIGKFAVKAMRPKPNSHIPFKMKTFKNLDPKPSNYDKTSVLSYFQKHQKNTLDVIEELRNMSLTKPKIITAAGSFFKMRIGDALHFMVAHNQRHVLQAQNVLRIIT